MINRKIPEPLSDHADCATPRADMFTPNPNHLTKEAFDKSYDGVPPWEIGRPQPEMLRLLNEGTIHGSVLDVGCGTGELALEMARRGLTVVGVDSSPKAIGRAIAKAKHHNLPVFFTVEDALALQQLHQEFDMAIDCGLFHVFSDAERPVYVQSLYSVLKPGGRLVLICFSDEEHREGGPRRVTKEELRTAFAQGWKLEELRAAKFDSLIHEGGAAAWLSIWHKE
jgi:SAM-dependent methyltransferase